MLHARMKFQSANFISSNIPTTMMYIGRWRYVISPRPSPVSRSRLYAGREGDWTWQDGMFLPRLFTFHLLSYFPGLFLPVAIVRRRPTSAS
ncbi:hypothetical protein B0H66DRAFT_548008 [Apodospora peruviana]|uniref:Uncharacterized protein n=1 Tax=Apodospora peruviana TaxID=516989 RepID=A0AAE0II31_9PEZI|nr:hypothetical protein B0H66DRAFT_548008 [Apodospora peruviana]